MASTMSGLANPARAWGKRCLSNLYQKMIAMAMGQVNRGQILAARHNPVCQSLRSFGGKEGIDQHSITFAIDQRGRVGHPGPGIRSLAATPGSGRAAW